MWGVIYTIYRGYGGSTADEGGGGRGGRGIAWLNMGSYRMQSKSRFRREYRGWISEIQKQPHHILYPHTEYGRGHTLCQPLWHIWYPHTLCVSPFGIFGIPTHFVSAPLAYLVSPHTLCQLLWHTLHSHTLSYFVADTLSGSIPV